MGVDRSAWAGYAFEGFIDEPSDLLRESKLPKPLREIFDATDEDSWEAVDRVNAWLLTNGLDLVTFGVYDNPYSDRDPSWAIFANGTSTSVAEDDMEADMEQPTESELMQLEMARDLLDLPRDTRIGWILQFQLD